MNIEISGKIVKINSVETIGRFVKQTIIVDTGETTGKDNDKKIEFPIDFLFDDTAMVNGLQTGANVSISCSLLGNEGIKQNTPMGKWFISIVANRIISNDAEMERQQVQEQGVDNQEDMGEVPF